MQRVVLLTVCFIVYGFISASPLAAQIKINEFSSGSSNDWVELFNESDVETSLDGYILKDNTETGEKNLEGTIPGKGFVIFEWNRLNQDEDSVRLFYGESVVDEISYGTNSLSAPGDNQSVGRMHDGSGSWVVFMSPTQGSSNVGSSVYSSPTPTPSRTPTPSNTPKPTKTPVPTKTPKPDPTSFQVTSSSDDVLSALSKQTVSTSTESTESGALATVSGDINLMLEPTDNEQKPDESEFQVASARSYSFFMFLMGGILLLLPCGILSYRKLKEARSMN